MHRSERGHELRQRVGDRGEHGADRGLRQRGPVDQRRRAFADQVAGGADQHRGDRKASPEARGRALILAARGRLRRLVMGLAGLHRRPHRALLDLRQQLQPEAVADDQDERGGMHAERRELGRRRRQQRNGQQRDQERALGEAGDRGGGVLEVGLAVGQIGDRQKRGLGGQPADRVADRQAGIALGGGRHRGDDPGQRRAGADEHRAGDDLAHAGAVGELVGQPGEPGAGDRNHQRRARQGGDHDPERPVGRGKDHRSPTAPPTARSAGGRRRQRATQPGWSGRIWSEMPRATGRLRSTTTRPRAISSPDLR
jgi:hypothetical protein